MPGSDPKSNSFLGDKPPKILVHDKVHHPLNPKQFHYRVQALSEEHVGDDGEVVSAKHIHVDLEAVLRDTTVEVEDADCVVDEQGLGSFVVPESADDDALHHASVLVATCKNLDGAVVYGKVTAPVEIVGGGSQLAFAVDTRFKDETEKLHVAFSNFTMQSYAGPTPIENSKNLDYMKNINADAGAFYDLMNKRYGRTPPLGSLRGAGKPPKGGRRLETDSVGAATGQTALWNCDRMGLDPTNPGCADFTSEEVILIDGLDFTVDGVNIDVTLKCVDCAGTIEGASIFATLSSDFDIQVPDFVDDVVDGVGDVIDDAGDVVDDVIDTGGDVVDDVVDTGGDIIDDVGDVIDDCCSCCGWRRSLSTVTAEVDFALGASLSGLAVDFSLLTELVLSGASGESLDYSYNLFSVFVPNLGIGTSVFGISLGAGLRAVATVKPDITSVQGLITTQVGAKLVFDGGFSFAGGMDLDSMEISEVKGEFSVGKWLDTPRITASVRGEFELLFNLELQCGLFSDFVGTGASIYAAVGVPMIVEGTVAASAPPALLDSIPSSFCDSDADTSSNFFFGDCTQPNNLQTQLSIYSRDIYGRVYAGVTFGLSGYGLSYTKTYDYQYIIEQSQLTGFGLELGPYTLTYCDCILFDGVDCAEQDTGSQCAVDAFPPQSQRVAPRYNADSPASGMALAWDQEEVGAIDAQPLYLTPAVVVGIVFGCLVILAIVIVAVVMSNKNKKKQGKRTVAGLAQTYGGQVKKKKNTNVMPKKKHKKKAIGKQKKPVTSVGTGGSRAGNGRV
eukprot:INCI11351.1.p1 GENE.INCI11351.1~~INCI11351.1.p1  ORF type:complete len:788 (-),score=165.28 INCI11351.1:448-2811(-)